MYIYTVFQFNEKREMFILTDVYCYYSWCFLFRLYIDMCIFMHRKCIFMHSQVYIYTFASVYLRIRKCIFTPQVYLYTTDVNIHLFGVNIEAKQFTPKKCIFTPVVYIYTGECVTILYTFFGVSTEAGIYTFFGVSTTLGDLECRLKFNPGIAFIVL